MDIEQIEDAVGRLDPEIRDLDLSKILVAWRLPDGTPMQVNGMPIFHAWDRGTAYDNKLWQGGERRFQGLASAFAGLWGTRFVNRFGTEYRAAWTMATWFPSNGEWGEYLVGVNRFGYNSYMKESDIATEAEFLQARKDFSPLGDEHVGDVEMGYNLESVWRQPGAADWSNVRENGIPLTEMPDTLPELGEESDPIPPTDEQREAEEIAKSSEIQRLEKEKKQLKKQVEEKEQTIARVREVVNG